MLARRGVRLLESCPGIVRNPDICPSFGQNPDSADHDLAELLVARGLLCAAA